MLLPAQIVPFLQHQDHAVRELALRYLAEANDPSPATADDLWKAIDHLGDKARPQFISILSSMPQTESSVNRTLQALGKTTDPDERAQFEDVLAELRYGLLMRLDDIIGEAKISDELRAHLKQRIELASVPPSELWDRLTKHAAEYDAAGDDWKSIDSQIAQRLIEALSRNPEAAQWAIATLNDPAVAGWSEIASVILLGEMHFAQAGQLIVDKLMSDAKADFLMQASVNALVKIGHTEVIRLIAQRFARAANGFKFHMTDALRRTKLAQSETAAIELLSREDDLDIRTVLANALCDLACTRPEGLSILETMVGSGKWNSRLLPLHTDVAALFTMLGKPVPTPPRSMPSPRQVFRDDQTDEELQPQAPKGPPTKLAPIRRAAKKVGRNDPCPCGSGKKYKKCCGK